MLSSNQSVTMNQILHLVKERKQFRTGVVFSTEMNNYFYDTGTGKILQLSDVEYRLLRSIFSEKATEETVLQTFQAESIENVRTFLHNTDEMCLMQVPELTDYKCDNCEEIIDEIDNELTQLVLEVTQQCNFRCKYCIYNSGYVGNHDFSSSEMTWETAKASIDYLLSHCQRIKDIHITFYGGEPLLRFDLIKKCVEYARENSNEKNLYFSLTTNLSLMDHEKAKFFADTPNFTLTVSIDGPKKHQISRVYADGRETYADVMRGMENVCKEFSRVGRQLTISSVLVPPYDYEKLDEINSFFESIPNLPKGTSIVISYASKGTYENSKYVKEVYNNPRYKLFGEFDPLGKWQFEQCMRNSLSWDKSSNLYFHAMMDSMVKVERRFVSDTPILRTNCIEGCCIPGARKLYVQANGELSICERIGVSPSIGNIHTGIDKSKLLTTYIDDYLRKSKKLCANCWAFNMCPMCYAMCFSEKGVDIKEKAEVCKTCRTHTFIKLAEYCTIMEKCPEALTALNKAVVV